MIVILEAKDLTILKLEQLIGSHSMHEMINITNEKKKKKDLSLTVSTRNNDGDNDEDEEVLLLSSKFKRFFIRREEGITKSSTHYPTDIMKCYKCRMLGRMMANRPF